MIATMFDLLAEGCSTLSREGGPTRQVRGRLRSCMSYLVTLLLWVGLTSPIARAGDGVVRYQSSFQGERTWIGPDYWTVRWQDWSVAGGRASVEARANRVATLLTHEVLPGDGALQAFVEITGDANVSTPAGIWLGVNGPIDDWRSAAAYGEYRAFAGVRPDGTLVLRNKDFSKSVTVPTKLKTGVPFSLNLTATTSGEQTKIELRATQSDAEAGRASIELPARAVVGLCGFGTADQLGTPAPPGNGAPRWHFQNFTLAGPRLTNIPDRTFGPIGWTQYSVSSGILKMSVMMMPVGASEIQRVQLQLDRDGKWETVADETMHPLSRSAHFRVDSRTTPFDTSKETRYRVRYEWNGVEHFHEGKLRPAPTGPVKIAVMNCDRGYVFPNLPIVANIRHRNADLLLYLGDQFYEPAGGHGIERRPIDRSSLDYLRKYALFGWANRDLLRDAPSIILPDDHDVFQGNVWGAGGRKQPKGGDEMGGYQGEGEWINIVMRTQSWHIPDAYDPTPIEQGITVHYASFELGGISFAVFEDRKWKTGYRSIWPTGDSIPRTDIAALDAPGAVLLGERQEKFLADWAKREPEKVHVAISQTIFAKSYTHTGPELNRNNVDFDTNGWPRSARNRAVATLGDARALHLVGDQHIGLLAQLGVEKWTDGPLTFMATGTANGWPRAWWPETAGENRRPGDPDNTGRYVDPFGNQITYYAVVNPEPGANKLTNATHTPYQIAEAKASGFGVVTIEPATQRARFEMWRFTFDPANPDSAKQFEGFPQTYQRDADGWKRVEP